MGEENRRNKRIEVTAYVDYTGSEVLLYHKIENISLGGMCIQAATVEMPGTPVDLVLNFPDLAQTVELRGEVVWASERAPHNMGIRFTHVTPEALATLEQYLSEAKK